MQSDTLLLADVFENFHNKCIEIYKLDPAHFRSKPGLAWQACLNKTCLTGVGMLLMVAREIRGGMCHTIHRYEKNDNKCMKNYDQNKNSS